MVLADNQDITRWGIYTLAKRHIAGLHFTEAQTLHEVSEQLAADVAACGNTAGNGNAVVVLDYTLLNSTEEELLLLHDRYPTAQILLYSDQLSRDFIRRMIYGSTAFSVLLKDCSLDETCEALQTVCRGEQFVCQQVRVWLDTQERISHERSPLSSTEREILKLLAMGHTTKDIAAERFLSVYTVMTHRKNIFRKLSVNNVQEAIRYALRAGIVDPVDYYI